MSLVENKKLFNSYKKKLEEKLEKPDYSKEEDPRKINWKPDNTYRFRLLFYLDNKSNRQGPFIDKYIHNYWNSDTKESDRVTCPTSLYLEGNLGFKNCPICNNNSNLWKEYKNGSQTAYELYKQHKRRFYGFALVYVVNDPVNSENNGKVRIMPYGITIQKFLESEVFGQGDAADPVGSDAFNLEEGYDLIIQVEKNQTDAGNFNKYNPKFAREKTSINIDTETIEKEIKELKFDEDFYSVSSKEELLKFYQDYVLDQNEDDEEEIQSDLEDLLDNEEEEEDIVKEEETSSKSEKQKPKEEKEAIKEENEDDIDIDSILEDIDNDYE